MLSGICFKYSKEQKNSGKNANVAKTRGFFMPQPQDALYQNEGTNHRNKDA